MCTYICIYVHLYIATTGTECLMLFKSTRIQWITYQWSQPWKNQIPTPSAVTVCCKLLSYGRDIMTSSSIYTVMLTGLIIHWETKDAVVSRR